MSVIVSVFVAFTLIHSVKVAHWFKHFCFRVLGDTFMRAWYRFLYIVVSCATAFLALRLIHQEPDLHLWTASEDLKRAMHAVQFTGAVFGAAAFRHKDLLEFTGVRQVWRYLVRGQVAGNIEGLAQNDLVTIGVYGIVRHPLYLAGIVVLTFNPIITRIGLTLTISGLLFSLSHDHRGTPVSGHLRSAVSYNNYMKKVPRLLPRLGRLHSYRSCLI